MQVEMWSLDRTKPYQNNPRINDDAVDPVVQSIRELARLHRFAALKTLGRVALGGSVSGSGLRTGRW